MAQVGAKATGGRKSMKVCVVRHGHAKPRSAASAEKAIETKVRRAGKKACQEY